MAKPEADFNEYICERIDSTFKTLNSNIEYQENRKKLIELHEEISKILPSDKQHLIREHDLVCSRIESISQVHCYKIGLKDGVRIIQF